ncbi:multiple epidermal growth factor-like domains protein 10 [Mercenaria mercenaria]|uniref:multiple epidermal growth factor-like domains protein 10 n=1 Tax=Mercenaria mercenaria TaxID=6596 RepID=UPI00234EE55A|nr:multiple epidermal growth factor-like domains protein 10 [Mercenaria mercenaria]
MNYFYSGLIIQISTVSLFHSVQGCPSGTFGRECMFTCHCTDGADCDDTSGYCDTGCAHGWYGNSCQQKNAAYGRPTSQKNGSFSQNASFAVDDATTTCSSSQPTVPGWWMVTLNDVTYIKTVVIKGESTTDIKGWRVYAGMDENRMSMTLCATVRVSGDGATIACDDDTVGNHVMVVNRQGPVVLCDFHVKVCSPQWFGPGCDHVCNCADQEEVCDSLSGACKTGCSAGWTGTDCYTPCTGNRYGEECKYGCGFCADDKPCNHVTGTCQNGCKSGWTGMFCTQQCPVDTHGPNCENICGHCYGVDACDVINGSCLHGCEPGFTGRTCTEECPTGWYGTNCSQKCGQCVEGSRCDPKIGVCSNGCHPGWQGVFCSQECPIGSYGNNCRERCTHCHGDKCDTETGRCLSGCASGYIGHNCSQVCPDGTFGINCTKQCGRCAEGEGRSCDAISGMCQNGCLPGYKEEDCLEMCGDGYYGTGCQKCGVCSPGTTCDPFTGKCPNGCALNYFGDICNQTEPFTDENGPQLAIFLGFMITTVMLIMISVTTCLVMIWRHEHLPEMSRKSSSVEKELPLLDRNGFVSDGEETVII